MERRNVKLALRTFSSFVSAALAIGGKKLQLPVLEQQTATFMDLIIKWWKVVNVKTPEKGHRQRDAWQENP